VVVVVVDSIGAGDSIGAVVVLCSVVVVRDTRSGGAEQLASKAAPASSAPPSKNCGLFFVFVIALSRSKSFRAMAAQ
jgi:hypothetical protein